MWRDRTHFLLLNAGHFLDHLFTLVFATVAALALHKEWGVSYAELLAYATPGFFAFGAFALPAAWLADRWSRDGMMCVFFIGGGLATILTGFAQTPLQIGCGLFAIGVFAAIYHPVGLAIVTQRWRNVGMRIAVNGVWGNLGVAGAALVAGWMIEHAGWRAAFMAPGAVSILLGLGYFALRRGEIGAAPEAAPPRPTGVGLADHRRLLIRVGAVLVVTSAVSGIVFQSTTFALPKIFDERLGGLAGEISAWIGGDASDGVAAEIGALAFLVFAAASMAQLIVGALLDRFGARPVYLGVAAIQVTFFAAMPGLTDATALAVSLGFMLGAFGQIPIGDFLVGKVAAGPARARVFAVRYVITFTSLAASLPLIGYIHATWGFDRLFVVLACAASMVFLAATFLPRRLPEPEAAAQPRPAPAE